MVICIHDTNVTMTVEIILVGYTGFVVIASFIHLIPSDYWWIRIWDFPHLQLTFLATFGLLAWAIIGPIAWPVGLIPIGLVSALLYQGWLIFPYTTLHRVQVPRFRKRANNRALVETKSIRLLTANVYMYNTQVPKMRALANRYDPDVLLVLEANEQWRQELASLEERYPYQILHPLDNTYGILFYSKLPIRHQQVRFLIQNDIPSIYTQLQLPSGEWIHFYGVHPMPPSPTEHYRSTERDAELVLVGQEARQQKEPVIVAGDLNDVAWSHTTRLFQRISGLFDPRVGRGMFSTFHARYFFIRWPLDHIFVSHHFRLISLRRLPNCGSDHFPMLVSLLCAPDPTRIDDIPQPEGDDLAEAREKVQKANES